MDNILISIKPKWLELICSGEKTVEVRKSFPTKIETPFRAYMYCTTPTKGCSLFKISNNRVIYSDVEQNSGMCLNSKIIGYFTCDKVYKINYRGNSYMVGDDTALTNRVARQSCLQFPDLMEYFGKKGGYGWHISEVKVFDEPKELSEFSRFGYSPMYDSGYCDNSDCKYCEWTRDMQMQYEPPFCHFGRCCTLERPPQSWCYVGDYIDA